MRLLALGGLVALALAGCGSSSGDAAPPPSSMNPKAAAAPPSAPPTTPEGKIEAIEKSGMSAEQKKQAIEQVKAGKL